MTEPHTPEPVDAGAELTAAHGALMSALASAISTSQAVQNATRQVAEITRIADTARDSILITGKRLGYAERALDDLLGTARQLSTRLDALMPTGEDRQAQRQEPEAGE